MAVPCVLVKDPKPHMVQTYVIKVAEQTPVELLRLWTQSEGIRGAGAFAIAEVWAEDYTPDFGVEQYLVITMKKPMFFECEKRKIEEELQELQEQLQELPVPVIVEFVRTDASVTASIEMGRCMCYKARHHTSCG